MTILTPRSLYDDLIRGRIDITTGTFKALLLSDAYVFSAAHTRRSDVAAFEHAATNGYTPGGVAITITSTIDYPRTVWQFGSATFGTGGVQARFVVYYQARGGAASADEILAMQDLGRWVRPTGPLICPAQTIRVRGLT